MSYTRIHLPTYTLRAVRVRLINTRQWCTRERRCVSPHLPEILTRDASVSSSHEKPGGPREGEDRVAREQAADRESFVRRTRAVHVAATRLEPPPSFPPPRSLKCQIIGRTYVRSFCAPVPPRFFPIHYLLFLNRERLDRFLLSPAGQTRVASPS